MPGGWVTSDIPSGPPVCPALTRCSNSEPIAQVPGPLARPVHDDGAAVVDVHGCLLIFVRTGFGPILLTVGRVPEPVKTRRYDSTAPREQAEATRRAVLRAARHAVRRARLRRHGRRRRSPGARGSRSTPSTPASAASRSCCSRCTTWCSAVRRAGAGRAARLRPARSARPSGRGPRSTVYAAALGRLLPGTVPLAEALRVAGQTDAGLPGGAGGAGRAPRRATCGCSRADLRATGELRDDLTDDDVADLVWSMNSPEYYLLVTGRGRDPRGVRRRGRRRLDPDAARGP